MTKINTDINKAPIEETIIIRMFNGKEYIGQVVELPSGKKFYVVEDYEDNINFKNTTILKKIFSHFRNFPYIGQKGCRQNTA